jgi:hypothetical protein
VSAAIYLIQVFDLLKENAFAHLLRRENFLTKTLNQGSFLPSKLTHSPVELRKLSDEKTWNPG